MYGREKRQAARVPVSMKVGEVADSKTLGFGYAQNLSVRGVAIDAQALTDQGTLPSVGTEIRIRFKLPRSTTVIQTQGRVVRVDHGASAPVFALEFLKLTPDYEQEISRFIEYQAKI